MQFQDPSTIYQQIADYGIEQIVHERWMPETRIPSVRKLAEEVGVNPNTVMRAYNFLQETGIIYNERGVGFFVAKDGLKEAARIRRQAFIDQTLPDLIQTLDLLGITAEELVDIIKNFKNGHHENR
ncbi:MAG: GntR family transcriptional regulator [Bacteroidota bacterium]